MRVPPKVIVLKISLAFSLQIKVAMDTSVVSNVSVDKYYLLYVRKILNAEHGTWTSLNVCNIAVGYQYHTVYCTVYYHACRASNQFGGLFTNKKPDSLTLLEI